MIIVVSDIIITVGVVVMVLVIVVIIVIILLWLGSHLLLSYDKNPNY